MFTLNIPDLDATGGSIPVSWCLDAETVKYFMESYKTEPNVLIVVAPKNGYSIRKETRYVVPLKDLMTYITFKRPGANRIYAMVFGMTLKAMRRKFLTRSEKSYEHQVLEHDGEDFNDGGDPHYTSYYGLAKVRSVLNVDVPQEIFAPEPSEWEKSWVLWLVSDKGVDQCDFRKRKIFAYTLQLPIFAADYLLRTFVTFVAASFLMKGTTLKFLKSPLQLAAPETLEMFSQPSLVLAKKSHQAWRLKDGDSLSLKNWFFMWLGKAKRYFGVVLMPFTWIVLGLGYALFGSKFFMFAALVLVGSLAVLVLGSMLLTVAFIIVLACTDSYLKIREKKARIKKEIDSKGEVPEKVKPIFTAEDIEWIICNPINTQPSYVKIESLPQAKRTLKLRFQHLKSKVCRPFPS